jgi:hypothetical protein
MASGCTGILMGMPKLDFENMTNHLYIKAKRLKLPFKVEDGLDTICNKAEKLTLQPN